MMFIDIDNTVTAVRMKSVKMIQYDIECIIIDRQNQHSQGFQWEGSGRARDDERKEGGWVKFLKNV